MENLVIAKRFIMLCFFAAMAAVPFSWVVIESRPGYDFEYIQAQPLLWTER